MICKDRKNFHIFAANFSHFKNQLMKKYLLILLLSLASLTAFAQINKENGYGIKKLKVEARVDFDCYSENDSIKSGFTGRYLNFIIAGDITPKFYYAYRQRINKIQKDYNFFDATDYLYLGWRITDNLAMTAGKEIVAMGGVEYDLAPIDVYFNSNFWDNFNCYRFGTNLEYTTKNGKNTFTLQFTNSPFDDGVKYSSLYNYSLHWRATFKHFGPVCSVNMYEYKKGSFLNVIALGTSFNFGPVVGYLDIANRAHGDQNQFFFKDMTAIMRCGYNFLNGKLQVFVKGGFDVNDTQYPTTHFNQIFDHCVLPGTDIKFYGGGFEFYPLQGKNDIRIHGFFAVSDVHRSMLISDGLLSINDTGCTSYQANIGLTWRLNFIDK